MDETIEKQSDSKNYRDYWIGIFVINLITILVKFFLGNQFENGITGLIGLLIFIPIFNALISLIILLIVWLFKRNFKLLRFLKTFSIWSFINLLFSTIYALIR